MINKIEMARKTRFVLQSGLLLGLVFGASSCSTNPFDEGYQAVAGLPPRTAKNFSPSIIESSPLEHEKTVRTKISQRAVLVGYAEKRFDAPASAEQVRLLTIKNNADVAVFSKELMGTSSQFLAVPLQSEKIETQKNTKQTNTDTRTRIGYREFQKPVWIHRVSLLRCPNHFVEPPQAPQAPQAVRPAPVNAPVIKSQTAPEPDPVTYETIKTFETTQELRTKLSGDP